MKQKPRTVAAYLASLSADQRRVLGQLRKTIRAIVPTAIEVISYGIPAFRVHDKVVAGFMATRRGYSYLPFSGTTFRTVAKDIVKYDRTKGSLHFTTPLPTTLVRKLVRARLAEIEKATITGS